jgi:hypothetical protein
VACITGSHIDDGDVLESFQIYPGFHEARFFVIAHAVLAFECRSGDFNMLYGAERVHGSYECVGGEGVPFMIAAFTRKGILACASTAINKQPEDEAKARALQLVERANGLCCGADAAHDVL